MSNAKFRHIKNPRLHTAIAKADAFPPLDDLQIPPTQSRQRPNHQNEFFFCKNIEINFLYLHVY
jgi:hypothetical protein